MIVTFASMGSTFRFERHESTSWDPPLLGEILVDDGSRVDMESLSLLRGLSLLLRYTRSLEVLQPSCLVFDEPGRGEVESAWNAGVA